MCGFKMGSDVYGLPSQEIYLDSQNFHSDAAKIRTISVTSKFWMFFFDYNQKRDACAPSQAL